MASAKDRKVRRGPAKSQTVKSKLRPKPISAEIAALAAHHRPGGVIRVCDGPVCWTGRGAVA
jgi:hypothetical protein